MRMKHLAGDERIGGSKKTATGMLQGFGAAVVACHHPGHTKQKGVATIH
jgi:hypothetical protein